MFVGGLKDDTTEDQIREVFSPFGKIENVDIVTDKTTGKVRGFAFVTFKDYDSVDKAVCKLFFLKFNIVVRFEQSCDVYIFAI